MFDGQPVAMRSGLLRRLLGVCIAASTVGGGLAVLTTSLSAPPAGATQNTTNVADCTYIPVTNGTPTVLLPTGSVAASVEEPTGEPSSQGDILFAAAAEQVTVECKTASLPTSVGGQTVQTTVVVETSPLGIVISNNGDSVYESSCGADAASTGPAGCLSDGTAPSLVLAKFFTSPGNDGAGNKITCPSTDECISFYLEATGDATFPFSSADSAAQCPPTAAQVNAGLTNCALAVFATTNTTTGAGTSINANLLTYTSQATSPPTNPLPTPAVPTLKLSPTSGAASATVSVSDVSSPTAYWWSDAMFSDGFNSGGDSNGRPLLASWDVPASDILVGSTPAASSSVVISPAAYTATVTGTCPSETCSVSGTLTDPAISGTFTLPSGLSAGATTVTIYEPNNAFADGNVGAPQPTGVTAGANITTPDISASASFTVIVGPTVTSISPTYGPAGGGTTVTITGTGFSTTAEATTVDFGTTAATGVSCSTTTSCTATSPAGSGTVDVTVTVGGHTSATSSADEFTYDTTPTVTQVSPKGGKASGGTVVTVTGTGFLSATGVKFGATAGTGMTVSSDTSLTIDSPSGTVTGTPVDIEVTNTTGTSSAVTADHFTYDTTPTVTMVSPSSGRASGGTVVTVTGTGFGSATGVKFGATAGTGMTVSSDTSLTIDSPSGTVTGTPVDIEVTNTTGTSSAVTADQFTYVAGSGLPISPPATTPSAPTALSATAGDAQVSLSWTAPSSNGGSAITGYDVYEGTSAGAESSTAVNGTTLVSGTTYTATGLTNGTKYYFTVEAVNGVGNSSASNEASATPVATPPPPPSNLCAAQTGNSAFVCSVYEDLLGRAPDSGGLAYWNAQLSGGASRNAVAFDIATSPEYRGDLVESYYKAYLGRASDPGGLAYWVAQLTSGASDQTVASQILGSGEFYADSGGTAEGFVTALYSDLLGRTPDSDGLAYWEGQLSSGTTPTSVAAAILSSTEYRTDYVQTLYVSLLGRDADAGGLSYWVAQLAGGQSNETVISGFVGSAEYYADATS